MAAKAPAEDSGEAPAAPRGPRGGLGERPQSQRAVRGRVVSVGNERVRVALGGRRDLDPSLPQATTSRWPRGATRTKGSHFLRAGHGSALAEEYHPKCAFWYRTLNTPVLVGYQTPKHQCQKL